jgi:hypothetical protein
MKTIRLIAAALLLAAGLMLATAETFFAQWMSHSALYTFTQNLRAASPNAAASTHLGAVPVSIFLVTCLGVALMVCAVFYGPVDDAVVALLRRFKARRHAAGTRAKLRQSSLVAHH